MDRRRFAELPEDLREWPDRSAVIEFNEIVLKACAKDPAQRYQSADEMRSELELLQRGKSLKRVRTLNHYVAMGKKFSSAIALLALIAVLPTFLIFRQRDGDLHSADPEVDTLVEQGNHCILEGTEKSLGHALDFFNQAIARDPKFAPAYVGVFRARLQQEAGLFHRSVIKEQNVRAAAAKLNEIAPKLAETRMANCYVKLLGGHLPEALAESRLALNAPTGSKEGRGWVHAFYGFFLVSSGTPEEALREFQIAKQIFPTDPVIEHFLGHPYRVQRKFDLALEHYQKSIDLEPVMHFFEELSVQSNYIWPLGLGWRRYEKVIRVM